MSSEVRYCTTEDGVRIDGDLGEGPTVLTTLSPGLHTVTLHVTDSEGLTAEATVQINVVVPTWADVKPDSVDPAQPPANVTVHVELPLSYDIGELDHSSLRLTSGSASLVPTAVDEGDQDSDGLADLLLSFETEDFVAAVPSGEVAQVYIVGALEDGTPIKGGDLVSILLARRDMGRRRLRR